MLATARMRLLGFLLILFLLAPRSFVAAQQSQATGEVQFTTDTQDERDAGVWIDGKYAGYVKELKGDRKVLLAPGEHQLVIRQAGYKDLAKTVTVAAGQAQTVAVVLETDTKMSYPGADAEQLRIDIQPKRAAVFVDGTYMGHGSDFGGHFHAMLVGPGKHHLRVALSGYQTYETDFTANANTKAEMKVVLQPGSSEPPAQ